MNLESHPVSLIGRRVRTAHRILVGRKVIPEKWKGTVVAQLENGPGWTLLVVLWDATSETDQVKLEEVEIL